MKKIKVLIQGLSPNLGGIEKYIYSLYINTNATIDYYFLVFNSKEDYAYQEIIPREKIIRITPRNKNYFSFLRDLKKVFKENKFDYIYFNLMDYSCFERIIYAQKYTKSKIIIHSHNAGFGKNTTLKTRFLHTLGKKIINLKGTIRIACGKDAGLFLFNGYDYNIFNNGIEIEKYRFNIDSRNVIREELNIGIDTTVFGIVARIERQKNPLFAIKVFEEYQKLNPNSVFLWVGDGSLRKELEKYIHINHLENKILLLGNRKDANILYSVFDIYFMPSLYEGLSISIVEAQTNGLKCFTSDRVDKDSNVTGNVVFIQLEKGEKEWAKIIYDSNISRDYDVEGKIPEAFDSTKSYNKICNFLIENLEAKNE